MTFFGLYRATVTDTDDPLSQGRVQVSLPTVGTAPRWAVACLPSLEEGTPAPPPVGSTVWVAFEAGDATRPVYLGVLPD